MERKQNLTAFLSEYGPDNPEPQHMKDSAKSSRSDLNALQAVEEYIEGNPEQ